MKNIKRFLVFGVLGLFLISMMGVVLAATGDELGTSAGEGVIGVASGLNSFFSTLFGKIPLSQIFAALLIGMFVYSALRTFFRDQSPWILNTATIAATGLAMIGLPENFLKSALTGYGAMGITILMIIPFLIMFWFTIKMDSIMFAKGIWLFYTVYYLVLYLQALATEGSKMVWPNFIAMGIGVAMFFFILYVRDFIFKGEIEEMGEKGEHKIEKRKRGLALEMERLEVDK